MAETTPYANLYKWVTTDSKLSTINGMATNSEIIDENLKTHNERLANVDIEIASIKNDVQSVQPAVDRALQAASDATYAAEDAKTAATDATKRIEELNDIDAVQLNERQNEFDAQLADIAINVKTFGAKGDGIADDTTAIQNAIDFLTNGGDVLFPLGTYKITSPIHVNSYVSLIGKGRNNGGSTRGTIILKDGNFDGVILDGDYSTIETITVKGATGNGGDGIVITGTRCSVDEVTTSYHGRDGLRVGTDDANDPMNANIFKISGVVSLLNGRYGLYIHQEMVTWGLPNVNAGSVDGGDYRDNGSDGIFINHAIDNTLVAPVTQNNKGYGIRFGEHASGNYVFNQYTEKNTSGQIKFDAGSSHNYIFGQRSSQSTDTVQAVGEIGENGLFGHDYTKAPQTLRHIGKHEFADLFFANGDAGQSGKWKLSQPSEGNKGRLSFEGTSSNGIFEVSKDVGNITFNLQKLGFLTSNGKAIKGLFVSHGTISIPEMLPHSTADISITLTGVELHSQVTITPLVQLPNGLMWSSYVKEVDKVVLRIANVTAATIPATNASFRRTVINIDA